MRPYYILSAGRQRPLQGAASAALRRSTGRIDLYWAAGWARFNRGLKVHDDFNWGRIPDFLTAQLWAAQMKIGNHFAEWFADTGLSAKQFGILYVISMNPGTNQRQLAILQSTRRAALGESLARLEEKGYIERTPAKGDRRAKLAAVTAAGRQVLKRILGGIAEQERAFTASISDSERHMLLALLLKINLTPPGGPP